jgi:hypothetical protein
MAKTWEDWKHNARTSFDSCLYSKRGKFSIKPISIEISSKFSLVEGEKVDIDQHLLYVAQGMVANNPKTNYHFVLLPASNDNEEIIDVYIAGDLVGKLRWAYARGDWVVAVRGAGVNKERYSRGFDSTTTSTKNLDLAVSKAVMCIMPRKTPERIATVKSTINREMQTGSCKDLRQSTGYVLQPIHMFRSRISNASTTYYDDDLSIDILTKLFLHWVKEDNLDLPWEIAPEHDEDWLSGLKTFLSPIDKIDFLTRKAKFDDSSRKLKNIFKSGTWVQINRKNYTYAFDVAQCVSGNPNPETSVTGYGIYNESTVPDKIKYGFDMFKVIGAGTYVDGLGIMFTDDSNDCGYIMYLEETI